MENAQVSTDSEENVAEGWPEVQAEIQEFFSNLGGFDQIHETFFWMLYYTLSNKDNNLDRDKDEEALFFFYLADKLFKIMYRVAVSEKRIK